MTYPYHERCVDNLKDYADFMTKDAPELNKKGYEIHAVLPHVLPDVREYKELNKLKYINWHTVEMGSSKATVKKEDYTSKKDKVVIYVPLLGTEYFTHEAVENIYADNTSYVVNIKLVF